MTGFIIMAASVIFSLAIIIFRKPQRIHIVSGFITGVIITILNMLVEWAGATYDIYYVSGPIQVLHTPISLLIAWIFLSFIFCSIFSEVVKGSGARARGIAFIILGIMVGWLFDYTAWRFISILRLGERGNVFIIALIWIVFVPLTVGIYTFLLKILKGKS